MAFGSKKKAKSAPTYNDTDLINELCDIVDCNVEELKQVVEDLCSFEEDGGAFIDGIAKILDCEEDAIYDEIKRIKELAESSPSEGTPNENETDEEVESAKQVVEELLKLFDCTDENLLDRVQSTQKLANQYYSVIVSLCEMLNCTSETVAETVQALIDSKGTSEESPAVDTAELDTLKEEVSKLRSLLDEEKTSSQKYKDACTDVEKKLTLYKTELSESKKEVKQLTEQVNKAKDIIRSTRKYRDELSEANTALKEENEALKKERSTASSKSNEELIDSLKKELADVRESFAMQTCDYDELLGEHKYINDKYQELLAKTQGESSSMGTLQELNCELKQKSHSLEEELSKVQKEQAKTVENLSAAEENVANLLNKVSEKTSELSKKEEELKSVRGELSEVTAKLVGYEDRISRVSELETEIKVYKEKEVQYTKMIEEITVAVDKQQENDGKSILNRLCTKFECTKEDLEEVISIALEGKMPEEDSFQSLSIELVKLRSENRVLRKNTELESQIVSSLRRIFNDCYTEQLYDEVVKAKEQAERVPSLDEEVSSLKTNVDTLQSEVEESKRVHSDIEEADRTLKDELEQALEENKRLSLDNYNVNEELNSLKKTLLSCKVDRKSLRDKNISLTSELTTAKDTLKEREKVVGTLRDERDSLRMRIDDLETDLINARVEGKKSSDRCTELQKRLAVEKEKQDNSEELVKYRVQVEDLNEALEAERTRSSELQVSVDELKDGKDKLLERIRSRDDMIESLKKEVEVHKASAKRLEQRLETDTSDEGTEN